MMYHNYDRVLYKGEYKMEEWWNLETINYFIKIAESKNITVAAKELFITQPSLSHQMQKIEEKLGISLYNRVSKGIVLTPQGEQFYECCKQFMNAYNEFTYSAAEINNRVVGTLKIGYPKSAERFLIKYNRAMIENHPHVKIRSIRQTTDNFLNMAATGEIDFFYAHSIDISYAKIASIKYLPIGKNPIKVLMSTLNPLSHRKSIHISELKECKFIAPSRIHAPGRTDLLFKICQQNGFTPDVIGYHSQQTDYNVDILTSYDVVSVQPEIIGIEAEYPDKLKFVELEGYEPFDEISLAWGANNSNPIIPIYVSLVKKDLIQ